MNITFASVEVRSRRGVALLDRVELEDKYIEITEENQVCVTGMIIIPELFFISYAPWGWAILSTYQLIMSHNCITKVTSKNAFKSSNYCM